MSYYKIPQSLEAAIFVFRIVRSLWNLTGTSAAQLPMCLSNFKVIRTFNTWSRICEALRDLTIRRLIYISDIETGPWLRCVKSNHRKATFNVFSAVFHAIGVPQWRLCGRFLISPSWSNIKCGYITLIMFSSLMWLHYKIYFKCFGDPGLDFCRFHELTNWARDKKSAILQTTLSNAFSSM